MTSSIEEASAHLGISLDELGLLRGITAFQSLNDKQLIRLMRNMRVQNFRRNKMLFCQGDPAESFIIVLDGWVRIYRSLPDGGEVTVNLFTRGESLAEAAIFAGNEFPVTGMTADDSRLVLVSAAGIRREVAEDPQLALNMMASMAAKMQFLVRQMEQLSHRTTKQRVAAFILTLAKKQKSSFIQLPLEKHLIAARLGMQPETFSRALTKLKADGIENIGGTIHITSTERLENLLQS